MKTTNSYLFPFVILLFFYGCAPDGFSQDFLPKFKKYQFIQQDTSNFYFREVWIKSKDVNQDNAIGFTNRAIEKVQLGYFQDALLDIDKSMAIDSTISYNYTLKGYLKFREDSALIALKFIEKAIALDTTDARNFYILGEIYMKTNKLAQADSSFRLCAGLNPGFYQAVFQRAIIALKNDDVKPSENLFKKVLELNPENSLACFNLAILYLDSNPGKTLKYLNKAIERDPNFALAWFFRGYLKAVLRSTFNPMLEDWKKAVDLDSTNILYPISFALLNIYLKRYPEGIDAYLKALKLSATGSYTSDFEKSDRTQRVDDFLSQISTVNNASGFHPDDEGNIIKEALGSFYNKDYENAHILYQKLLTTSSFKGLIYYLMGYNQEYFGKTELAIECYKNSGLQNPFPPEAFLRKGFCYMTVGKYREAINSLNIFIQSNDSIKFAYRCRALSYIQVLQFDSAIMDFDRFLKLDSTASEILFARAVCYKTLGNYGAAIKHFAALTNPESPIVLESKKQLAECKYLSGDTLGAFLLLSEMSKTNLFGFDDLFLRGLIFLNWSKYDSAIRDFTFYINRIKTNILAYMYRGEAFMGKQDYQKAIIDYSAALSIEPNNKSARYNRGLAYFHSNKKQKAYDDFKFAESLGHPLASKFISDHLKSYVQTE